MRTGIIKMFRDIAIYKGRSLLAMAGILIGISAVGAVLSAYTILNREMNRNFMDTKPASIVLYVSNLDVKAGTLIKKSYPDLDFEFRKTAQARISKGDGIYGTMYLRALQDFNNLKVDTFTLEKGNFPANTSQMVLERDSLKILKNVKEGMGEKVIIKLPGYSEKEMELIGLVHAPGLPPASMENYSYAFLSLDALKSLGCEGWYDELHIVSYEGRFDRVQMATLSKAVSNTLVENGYVVNKVDVPVPGKHPHADQLNSLLFLLQAFTLISLFAACLIIINLINFIMSRQTRQIAIMKSAGAGLFDIVLPNMIYILIISIASLAASLPISALIAQGYSDFAAGILNFKIASYSVPAGIYIIQLLTGLLLPLASAAYPIYRSCTTSIREGLFEKAGNPVPLKAKTNPEKNTSAFANSRIVIPVKNLLRKRTRTILAVLALLTGGVLYMASRNITASIDKTVNANMNDFRWDYEISVAGSYPEIQLNQALNSIEGLTGHEIWKINTMRISENGSANSVYCPVRIIPGNSQMLNSSILERFRNLGNENTIIVNNGVAKNEEWIRPGKTVSVQINGKNADVIVSDIVNEVPGLPAAYLSSAAYERLFGGKSAILALAQASTRDYSGQREISKSIEAGLSAAGIEINENWNIYLLRKAFADHLTVIITFLTAISILAVVVGGLSIGSAIGLNITERKREIGILRAVGANTHITVSTILSEVLIMGIASWIAGTSLSYPVSVWVGNYFGQIFLNANLQNTFSSSGALQWLVISIGTSLVAGLLPAWKASAAPLGEMLSYE